MGIAERKEREKEQRRVNILDAAEKLFFSKGVDTTTMDEVAEAAELSKGTLYLYFQNKDDLYHGVHLRGLNILKTFFEVATQSAKTGIEKVRAIGEAYFRFATEQPNHFMIMMSFEPQKIDFTKMNSFGIQCHNCADGVMEIVAGAVAIGIQDGSIRPELDPKMTAYILWGQTTGLIQIVSGMGDHLKEQHKIEPTDLIPNAFEMIYHALVNK